MLMQNFKSATDLGISEAEQAALIKVLGMLERGDLVQVNSDTYCDNGFNMSTQGLGCGTPACIGGWVALLMGINQREYVDGYTPKPFAEPDGLADLYWNEAATYGACDTTGQAAAALRNYLTTGDAAWWQALA